MHAADIGNRAVKGYNAHAGVSSDSIALPGMVAALTLLDSLGESGQQIKLCSMHRLLRLAFDGRQLFPQLDQSRT